MLEMIELQMGSTNYDLSLDVIDNPEGDARVTLMGQSTLYSNDDMKAVADMFEDILEEFTTSPTKHISENWQYRQADIQKAIDIGQGEVQEKKWHDTLIEQFESVVPQHQDKVALIHANGISLTYGQMQQRLDTIAAALMDNGVKSGDSVGLFQESTTDWICSMLAIWKVGSVFVPLDAGTITKRLAMIVSDCRPAVILVDAATVKQEHEMNATRAAYIDVSTLLTEGTSDAKVDARASQNGSAMIYYTSGSTGIPKGIAVKHEGLRAVFESSCQYYGVNEQVISLVQSSLGFDISLIQMFIAWPAGGTVCLISRDMRGDALMIMDFMIKHKVTHTTGTPSEYNSWLTVGDLTKLRSSAWRVAICGAEAFPMSLMDKLRQLDKPDLQLFHIYGTTETTIYATQQELNWKDVGHYAEGSVPAGYSLANKAIYIVDESLHLLPLGLPGEIVLAGVGVAEGYNNNENMTKASFFHNSFAADWMVHHGWNTMYRSRDRSRLMADGSILIEGRIGGDTEIKLRGQRIDLKDIEQTILRTADGVIADTVASARSIANEVIPQGLFDDLSPNSDFFHVGGTSLLLIRLQALINQRLGILIRLADLFANSTLRPMSILINQHLGSLDETMRLPMIDWEWETRPSPDLRIGTAGENVVRPAPKPRSILVTGGAGFLGRSLLRSAMENPHIDRVHAVAVRQLEKRLATGLLPQHPKVIYYEGDLREPRLGLSEADAEYVFTDIDAVIHNGADVSHLKSYYTLRRANLNATKELARLCLPRRIPFHYVSTAGVSMFTFWQSFGETSASAAQPPTDGMNGYKASKWASERFLERLNEQLKLPVWMHRPSDMVRDDDEEASWDLLHTLLGYSRKLAAVPVSENLWGWLDLVAVSRVSNDVVQMVHDNLPRSLDGGVSYVHQTGDMAIPIEEMKEFFEEECGHTRKFEKLPIDEWARRAEVAGMRPAVAAVFGNVPRLARALCFPRFVKTWRPAEGQEGGMLLVRNCACGGTISLVWGEGCGRCGKSPVMPTWS
ncbi:uncharacterized protein BCR38DRAFT_472189 [Pseudomassariella vexata]|uniref:Carrier domain-containing protein n=1 Tax=Pseudomassariella vexata TaxID=1141098 RepID=A0A1Y2EBL1_9PEZI|nr:uncharacterized protein BCR38DRAFT_472189 [Pseudomassariella vexata]ORY68694.1 hypothetical protein BCR38DRAFT_472189 [Pseudomassariella vexata]